MPWFLYVVRCEDSTLYTGITTDIARRIKEHNSKKGAFYTKNKTPVELVYQEAMEDQSQARKREAAIKRLTRKEKLELVENGKGEKNEKKSDLCPNLSRIRGNRISRGKEYYRKRGDKEGD